MIKTKPKPAERAVTAPGFDYDGLPQPFVAASRKRAGAIKQLDGETGKNLFKMAQLLSEQRASFGSLIDKSQARGGDTWDAWVKAELGWKSGRKYANRLIQMTTVFGDADTASALGFELMRSLSSTSAEPIRDKVVAMAKAGNTPTTAQVAQMKKEAAYDDRPTPTEAKAKAKETGEVVIGSDNKFYTPLEESEAEAHAEKTQRTYDVLDAIKLLSDLPINAEKWLAEAEPHCLTDLNLGSIEDARDWLAQLAEIHRKKEGIIDGH